MRRLLKLILAVNLGFWVGMGASELWLRVHTVPYCQVARNSDRYHGRFISVRARLIFGTGGLYVSENCDPTEALASLVEFEDFGREVGIGYVNEVLVTGEKPAIKIADAIN